MTNHISKPSNGAMIISDHYRSGQIGTRFRPRQLTSCVCAVLHRLFLEAATTTQALSHSNHEDCNFYFTRCSNFLIWNIWSETNT